MPRARVHKTVGVAVGTATALYHARSQPDDVQLLAGIGGALGGAVGGLLPDCLDPADCPHHRDLAHGLTTAVGVAAVNLGRWRDGCYAYAARCDALAAQAPDGSASRVLYTLAAAAWRILAGFLSGLQGGYLSHLTLDAFTPAGLPLVCR